ncbi:MAG: carboxymuconolactone decarboxylase family protein [Acidimicrobiales bacterium]|jgi:alkylhydroperoxidase family enzyme
MADVNGQARGQALMVADALGDVEEAAWGAAAHSGRLEVVELVNLSCAEQLGLQPLTLPPRLRPEGGAAGRGADHVKADGLSATDRAILEFGLQFSLDVSSVTDEQRSALSRMLGDKVAGVATIIFVMDFIPRVRAALEALVGDATLIDPAGPRGVSDDLRLWDALGTFIRDVPQLDALDPITSELVRLRGARQHQCRLCKSLRSRSALLAGADEGMFTDIDDYESSDLSPLQKAALAFTDAMIWTPGHLETSAARLAAVASVEQRVELVLDVTRNALNKIAVALGADAAHVDEGIEIYDVTADGEVVFGLTLD